MSFLDPVARIEREHAANLARESDFKTRIDMLKAKQQEGEGDFDTLNAIDEEIAGLERKLKLAEGVTANSADRLASAKTEAADKAADASHAAAERQAKTDEKLVRGALSAIEKAIAEIEAVAASVARTDDHNAERGARAFIADAEKRVRQRPGRTIPAQYEDREFWRDGSGREATVLRKNERGEMVPMEAGYTKSRERVCVQPERHEPATMPDRLAELLPALKKAVGA